MPELNKRKKDEKISKRKASKTQNDRELNENNPHHSFFVPKHNFNQAVENNNDYQKRITSNSNLADNEENHYITKQFSLKNKTDYVINIK